MKLRQLFEGMGQEVAIIFGRFNPPHKGHRAAWELANKSPVWYVGTNESTVGPKDPLPYGIKVEAMTAIWPDVEGHIIAETSWLTLASLVYEKHGDVTLLCLTDEDWVTKTIIQYNGKEGGHGFYNFKNIKQKPTPRLSSATALRDAVSKGDREAFAAAAGVDADTPVSGKPFFDLVAEYLLPYANAPVKKAAKKKVAAPAESVAEGVAETVPMQYAQKVLNHYGADYFKTTHDTLYFYKYRKQFSIGRIRDGDSASAGSVSLSELNAMVRKLRGMRVPLRMAAEGESNAMANTVSRLADKDDGKIAKLRAAGDKRREDHLKGRDIAKRDTTSKDEWGNYKKEDAAGVGIITKQNSTVDVNKGTPRKNLKAFRLVK
jgi:hypothetical protein